MPNVGEAGFLAMRKQSWVLGVLLALMPALSAAQADRFRAIDRNGDRSISSEEWYGQSGVPPVPFTVVDSNGDGRISESEFREWSSARGSASARGITPADRFRALDKDKDGVVSAEEWKDGAHSQTPFASVDANKDGKISPREFSTWDQRRPAVAAPAPPPGSAVPTASEQTRGLDRGAAGVSGPTGITVPPAASSRTSPLAPPVTATPSTSTGTGVSSPNMRSGSANTTK